MEQEFYNIEYEVESAPTLYEAPTSATHYRTRLDIIGLQVLPISHLLLDRKTRLTLKTLRKVFRNNHYDFSSTSTSTLEDELDIDLQILLNLFKNNEIMDPVVVRSHVTINNPKPENPLFPDVFGFGAATNNDYPILTNFFYQIIEGSDRVALSIFFGYDFIPIIVRF